MRQYEGYKIIVEQNIDELEDIVNEALNDGWEPLGAPVIIQRGINTFLVQAIVKEASPISRRPTIKASRVKREATSGAGSPNPSTEDLGSEPSSFTSCSHISYNDRQWHD